MKRYLIVLLTLALITNLVACNSSSNESSDTSVSEERGLPRMLLGLEYDSNIISEAEIGYGTDFPYSDVTLKTMPGVFGEDDVYNFRSSQYLPGHYSQYNCYSGSKTIMYVDSHSGVIQRFAFIGDIPEDRRIYKEQTDIDTAEKRVVEFLEKHYSGSLNLDEYELSSKYVKDREPYYSFWWSKYKNCVRTGHVYVSADSCGNIDYVMYDYGDQLEEMIPDYTEEEYLEACQQRLEELYAEAEVEAEIMNIEIHRSASDVEIQSVYMRDGDKFCVECIVRYDIVYPDGRVSGAYTHFYYPYAEGNDYEG